MAKLDAVSLAGLMMQFGFETLGSCSILNRLSFITPKGGTALRDSIQSGITLTLSLSTVLMEVGVSNAWNFVHIVITDGSDTASKCSHENLANLFLNIGEKIPKEKCLTVFIGIDLDDKAIGGLALLTAAGGDNCQCYNINSVDLDSIFEKITAEFIAVRREIRVGMASAGGVTAIAVAQKDSAIFSLRKTNFAVLLNLDISGSMKGARFESLKGSVSRFLKKLDGNDIVSCLVFNNETKLLQNFKFQPAKKIARPPPARVNNSSNNSEKKSCCCKFF